mmetsp:Transcript_24804/g.52833  ORF Transcript_24804/g.52833 Transcript_24804/m.52833 type:complete len:134 (-) Transcript_24804:1362-1763(-)
MATKDLEDLTEPLKQESKSLQQTKRLRATSMKKAVYNYLFQEKNLHRQLKQPHLKQQQHQLKELPHGEWGDSRSCQQWPPWDSGDQYPRECCASRVVCFPCRPRAGKSRRRWLVTRCDEQISLLRHSFLRAWF